MRAVEDRAGDGYRGERGREYHERVHGQQLHSESVYRARAELARHRYFRHLPASARVFELGLGTGSNLAAIEAAEVAGFDLSETAREVSREHGIHVFDSLDEAPEGHYDVVLLRHVLEHLPDPALHATVFIPKRPMPVPTIPPDTLGRGIGSRRCEQQQRNE